MQAAGGLVTTAADLAKWLEVQLQQGRFHGRQVFPKNAVAETQRMQTPQEGARGEIKTVGYGFGWNLGLLDADTVWVHGGTYSAFQSQIAFDRRHRIGVAVLTNEAVMGGGACQWIVEYVIERARDREAARQKAAVRLAGLPALVARTQAELADGLTRRAGRQLPLAHPLEAYAGTYESPIGGVMTWSVRDGRLWAEIGVLKSVAEVYDHTKDQLRLELEPGLGKVATFRFADDRATGMVFDRLEYARK